uniref:Uncharacterized protein n=1 Tax=Panagrolaimus superbus TaxID=310955 RepID=A0A914YKW2_9BILA
MEMEPRNMTNSTLGHVHHLWGRFLSESRGVRLHGVFNHNLVLQIVAALGDLTENLDMSHFEFLNRFGRIRSFIIQAPLLRSFLFDSRSTDNPNLLTTMKWLEHCYVRQANFDTLLIVSDDIPNIQHMGFMINNRVMPITHDDSDITFINDVIFDDGVAAMMNHFQMHRYGDTEYHLPGAQYETRAYVMFAGLVKGRHFTFLFLVNEAVDFSR